MPLGLSWHDYNEALVERGRVLFDLGFASSWNDEVSMMNHGKVGRPYAYPNSYISFLSFLKVGFNIPYRTVEGITEALSEYLRRARQVLVAAYWYPTAARALFTRSRLLSWH